MDEDVENDIQGFALQDFLGSFLGQDIDASSLSAIGLGGASTSKRASSSSQQQGKGIDAAQLFKGRYVDDEGEDGGSDGWDEDEIDRELAAEDMQTGTGTTSGAPAGLQLPAMPAAAKPRAGLLRNEDEDFDEDDEDEQGDGGAQHGIQDTQMHQSSHLDEPAFAGFNLPDASEIMHVKQEELDGDVHGGLALPATSARVQTVQDDAEEDPVDDAAYAAQQALFAQSYARMQGDATEATLPLPGGQEKALDARTLYPDFAPDKVLNFTDIFHPRARKRVRIDPTAEIYPLPRPPNYSTSASTRDFRSHHVHDRSSAIASFLLDALREEAERSSDDELNGADAAEAMFEKLAERVNAAGWNIPTNVDDESDKLRFLDWEDEVVWDASAQARRKRGQLVNGHHNDHNAPYQSDSVQHGDPARHERFGFKNPDLESGDWIRSVVWSSTAPFKDFTRLQLNLNDPAGPASSLNRPADSKQNTIIRHGTGWSKDAFNLSNDKLYEVRKESKKTVRQTFGHLEVQHSYPAMKLQFPWYKTQLSKIELRSFHRLPLQFPINIRLSFSKVRTSKKKKDKTGRKLKKDSIGAEAFRSMGDLSLSQTGNFILFEFSEENPVIIPNIGMGSILVNYYRKTDVGDSYVPREELGEPFLLDPSDESPFMRFGQVEPGQMVPALYNNLIRAPLFKHPVYATDFVVVKTTINNETKFFIRDIKHIFVVGQTYPLTDVPGPQSRKLTATAKHRLQSIAYKLVSRNPKRRVKINKLLKYFPDQTEMQMRQRLKEFMEYNRAGDDQRFWKIKDGKMPTEDELFKLIRPENVVLAESTQVGQRNLLDAGLSSTVDEEKGKENEASTLDIRQQLAPWFTTKNFLNAAQNKAMLKLHGEGDPSNRGEGFSFLRVSMKDIFLRAGEKLEDRLAEIEARPKSAHRYNVAEQQAIYKAEIDRIWRAQYEALSSPYEPAVREDDEIRWRQEELKMESNAADGANAFTPADGMSMSPGFDRDRSPGALDGQPKGPPKVLRIRRLIDGVWTSEIVRDQGVIKGYLRSRQSLDAEEEQDPESLVLTGDPEHDEVVRKKLAEHLEKLRKNQERRLQRKNAKKGGTGDVFLPGGKKIKNETTRKCGNCGQIGHMKTNRKCPKWAEFNAAMNQQPGANAPSAPANPFAVGLPGLPGVSAGSPT